MDDRTVIATRPETPARIVMRRFRKHKAAELALLALVTVTVACLVIPLFVSEADKVRRALGEMMEAAEARSPRGVTEMMTDDFAVTWRSARVGKADVHRAMMRLFLVDYKHGFDVEVTPKPVPIAVSEDETSAVVRFTITAKGKPSPQGDFVKLGQREAQGKVTFVMTWAKVDGDWKAKHLTFKLLEAPVAAKTE